MVNRAYNIVNDVSGDIVVDDVKGISYGDETGQLQQKILLLNQGDLKHDPETGVGITEQLLEDDSLLSLQHDIQKQFEMDNLIIESMDLSNSSIIKAKYDSKS